MSRRALLGAGFALALLAAAVLATKALLDVDRHRPGVVAELERLTGLPASVGRLDLGLLPWPHLSAQQIEVGGENFGARTREIVLRPDLSELLRRRVVLSGVQVRDLSLSLPADAERALDAGRELLARLEAGLGTGDSDWLRVQRIGLPTVRLTRGGEEFARGSIQVTEPGSSARIEWDLSLASLSAASTGSVQLQPPGTGDRLAGSFAVRVERSEAPAGSLDAEVEVRGDPDRELRFEARAETRPGDARAAEGIPLDARLVLTRGEPTTTLSFELEAEGFAAAGALAFPPEADPRLQVERVDAEGVALARAFASLGIPALSLGGEAARARARSWQIELPSAAAPRLVSGEIGLDDVRAAWNGRALSTPWHLSGEVADGEFRIDALGSGPIALAGSVAPAAGGEGFELSLGGVVALEPELVSLLGGPEALGELRGTVEVDELETTLPLEAAAPPRYRLQLRDGGFALAAAGFDDRWSGIELELSGVGGELAVSGRGRSRRLGEVALAAKRDAQRGRVAGELRLDAAALARALPEPVASAQLQALLVRLGASVLEFELDPPGEGEDRIALRVARRGAPRLDAALVLRGDRDEDRLEGIDLRAEIPANVLLRGVEGIRSRGTASLRLQRSDGAGRFSASLDGEALELELGGLLHKARGEPLALALRGHAGAEGWTPRELTLSTSGSPLRFVLEKGRWVAPDAALDLAPWSLLLPEGLRLGGRLEGRIETAPLAGELKLVGAALGATAAETIPRLDGAVGFGPEGWRAGALRLRAPDTDLTLEAASKHGQLSGSLKGPTLDADAVWEWIDSIRAARRPADPQDDSGEAPSGQIEVVLDTLRAGRSQARNLRARLRLGGGDLHVDPLALDTYEGRVEGTVSLLSDGALRLGLDVRSVTGRFLDDLLFSDSPQGVRGVFQGDLRFEGPAGDGIRPLLAAGSGRLVWSARQGSFGKLGLATRLITVLRASELLRLKLPSIRDEGLVFDTVESSLAMQSGRMTVERFQLESTTYAISATGTVDFAADRCELPIEFDAIRGVSAILEPIPIAGDALKIARVRLVATGSPYDMKIGVASLKDQVLGATTALPRATVGRIRDALELLKKLNGRTGTAPEETPPEAPTTE